MRETNQVNLLERIAASLEALAGNAKPTIEMDLNTSHAFVWQPQSNSLRPVPKVQRVPIELLIGIDDVRDTLIENTMRFGQGLPANNALLWGARGTGKSSVVKAVHHHVDSLLESENKALVLVEIQRDDIGSVETLLDALRDRDEQFLLYCDDLSFDHDDASYKSLKALLDGGVLGRPDNVIFYATSNRRHLLPRDMIENERASGVHPGEAVEEKLSLSDRFGLWLGFHRCDQETFLRMIRTYCEHFGLDQHDELEFDARQWATTRGSRSGRVAWQFIQHLAGSQGKRLNFG